jgi:protein-serine/threonine kinase
LRISSCSDCPPWLQELILKCLEVKPGQRYQSAALLAMALQAPGQIPLTQRAEKLTRSGAFTRLKRWFLAWGSEPEAAVTCVAQQLRRNPIIMVAVDVEGSSMPLQEQLRETVRRLLLTEPGARLACTSVMRTHRIGMDEKVDASGQSVHVKQLVQLKHWARPISKALKLDEGRLTFHVLEAPDAAAAIIDFARRNGVDHIVMGARGNSALRRYLGSVSSQVVAESDCTVSVVRVAARAQALGPVEPPA